VTLTTLREEDLDQGPTRTPPTDQRLAGLTDPGGGPGDGAAIA
jgi:hypothetical protein